MCAKVGFHGLITAIRNGGYRRVSPVAPRPREGPLTEPIAGVQSRPQERVLMPHSSHSSPRTRLSLPGRKPPFLAQKFERAERHSPRL